MVDLVAEIGAWREKLLAEKQARLMPQGEQAWLDFAFWYNRLPRPLRDLVRFWADVERDNLLEHHSKAEIRQLASAVAELRCMAGVLTQPHANVFSQFASLRPSQQQRLLRYAKLPAEMAQWQKTERSAFLAYCRDIRQIDKHFNQPRLKLWELRLEPVPHSVIMDCSSTGDIYI